MQQNDNDGSFFHGIKIASNNRQQRNETSRIMDDQNLFDQSSLYGVIEGIEERKDLNLEQ